MRLSLIHILPGAQIDFVITHVDREAGFAIGSRRLALASRRYFFSTQPLHQPGSRVPCHVLAVGPRRCLVECYGYDVNLSQRDMSYAAIPDLREQYHPGDELTCVVKQFDRKTGTCLLYTSFCTAALDHGAASGPAFSLCLNIRGIECKTKVTTDFGFENVRL